MPTSQYVWDYAGDAYLMEKDENAVTKAVFTTEPVQFGKLVSQRRNNVTNYYHADGRDSTSQLTTALQSISDAYAYSAFGNVVEHSGITENPFRFTGIQGYYTSSGGAMDDIYVRHRYFNLASGRWLAPDPLGGVGDAHVARPLSLDPQTATFFAAFVQFHLYTFADNNPVRYVDPSGQKVVTDEFSCPRPCPGGKCQFELELTKKLIDIPLQPGPQLPGIRPKHGPKERDFVYTVVMRYKPKEPQVNDDLAAFDCILGACYGGFNRSKKKDYIKYTLLNGRVCKMDENSFQGQLPYPHPASSSNLHPECIAVIEYYGEPLDPTWGGAELAFRSRKIAKIEVRFTIETQCICGIGHVEIEGVDPEYAYNTATSELTLEDKLP